MIPDLPDDYIAEDREQERQTHLAGVMARAAEEAGLIAKTGQFSFNWHSMFDAEIAAEQGGSQVEGAAPNIPSFNLDGEIGGNF